MAPSNVVSGQNISNSTGAGVTVQAVARGWSRVGACIRGKGRCGVAYSDEIATLRTPRVQVSVHDGYIDLIHLTPSDPENNSFTMTPEDEFYVDAEVAKDLGYKTIKVLSGTYTVDLSRGQYGGLLMNVETTN